MRKQWVQLGETNKSMAPFIQQLLIRDYLLHPPSQPKLGGRVLQEGCCKTGGEEDAGSYRRWDSGKSSSNIKPRCCSRHSQLQEPPLTGICSSTYLFQKVNQGKPKMESSVFLTVFTLYLVYTLHCYLKA